MSVIDGNAPDPTQNMPAAFDASSATAELQKMGYAVYPKGFQFDPARVNEDAFLKPIKDRVVADRTSEIAFRIEQDIFEATGIQKLPDEKYYDYAKRTGATLRDQVQKAPDVKAVETQYKEEMSKQQAGYKSAIGELAVRQALTGKTLNTPPETQDSVREMLIAQSLTKPYRVDGSRIIFQTYGGEDRKTLIDVIDPATQMPMSADAYLSEQFKNLFIIPAPSQTGTGGKPALPTPGTVIPANERELSTELLAEGYQPGPAFQKEYAVRKAKYMIVK